MGTGAQRRDGLCAGCGGYGSGVRGRAGCGVGDCWGCCGVPVDVDAEGLCWCVCIHFLSFKQYTVFQKSLRLWHGNGIPLTVPLHHRRIAPGPPLTRPPNLHLVAFHLQRPDNPLHPHESNPGYFHLRGFHRVYRAVLSCRDCRGRGGGGCSFPKVVAQERSGRGGVEGG